MKIGDVVRLVGGGPKMTVIGSPSHDLFKCAWFDVNHCYNEQAFKNQTLSLVIYQPALDCL